jgi:hypothetical protein
MLTVAEAAAGHICQYDFDLLELLSLAVVVVVVVAAAAAAAAVPDLLLSVEP